MNLWCPSLPITVTPQTRPSISIKQGLNAFTLVEILIVVIIVGLLSGLAIWKLADTKDLSEQNFLKASINSIDKGIEQVIALEGSFPTITTSTPEARLSEILGILESKNIYVNLTPQSLPLAAVGAGDSYDNILTTNAAARKNKPTGSPDAMEILVLPKQGPIVYPTPIVLALNDPTAPNVAWHDTVANDVVLGWNPQTGKYYVGSVETTLNSDGTGTWNNQYYINGELTALDSTGTGLNATDSIYYVNGVATNLASNGSGLNGADGLYYIYGVAQSRLNSEGTGVTNEGLYVVTGQVTNLDNTGRGYWNDQYYVAGQVTPLDQNGRGGYNGSYYIDGVIMPGLSEQGRGVFDGTSDYYVNGQLTSLDVNGNGLWEGTYHIVGYSIPTLDSNGTGWHDDWTTYFINGSAVWGLNSSGTGLSENNNSFYVGGQETTLDTGGTGSWNNTYYINGSATSLNEFGSGNHNDVYYYNGYATTLPSNGGGWDSNGNTYYIGGTPYYGLNQEGTGELTGMNQYWINAQQTTLDTNGNGSWNSQYYISGQSTTLDETGTGNWNGTEYVNGVVQ